MQSEIRNFAELQLKTQSFCSVEECNRKFPKENSLKIAQLFMNLSQTEWVNQLSLLCHIVIEKEEKIIIRYESFTRIQQGFIEVNQLSIPFATSEIKEFKVVALYCNSLPISNVLENLQNNKITKIKHSSSLKMIQSLKETQKNNSSTQNAMSQKECKPQSKKIISQDNPKKESLKMPPLLKITNKPELKTTTLHNSQKQITHSVNHPGSNKKRLKMNLESDEEYYDKEAFVKSLGNSNGKQTGSESSGKKNAENIQVIKMDIEEIKNQQQSLHEDSDEDDLIAKMKAKKQPMPEDSDDDDDDLIAKMKAKQMSSIAVKPITESKSASIKSKEVKPQEKPKKALAIHTKESNFMTNWARKG